MLEKWKQRAITMNLRKAVMVFVITGFVLVVASSVAVYSNFQNRISEWEQLAETDRERGRDEEETDDDYKSDSADREHREDFKERKEKDREDILKRIHLSAEDIALSAEIL